MFTPEVLMALLLTFVAGASTIIGSVIALLIKDRKGRYLCFILGFSAGVMIYVSFAELLPQAIADVGFLYANIAFFLGIVGMMLMDFFIPHHYIYEKFGICNGIECRKSRGLMKTGVAVALGIGIHNLPEGIVVFMSALKDINLGIILAIAIALHNIPEGISVSVPIYYATKSKKKAFFYSAISGLAEPVGAIIGFLILRPFLSPGILSAMLAFAAGIMVFVSFDELLPTSFREGKGRGHMTVFGVIIGMFVMALSLYLTVF